MVLWQEEAYTRTDKDGQPISFETYKERTPSSKWYKFMSGSDAQLYAVTGVGFFLDSYDLFIVNLVSPIWEYEYWGAEHAHYPPLLRGTVNAAANIGNIIGQLSFGYMGDIFGRRFVYGNELIIGTIGLILTISLPNSIPTATGKMMWIFWWRLVLGIGIGGDYPMSAAIMAERAHLKKRGQLLSLIFSNQGWGTFAASVVTLILLACFSHALDMEGKYGQLDAIWRLQMGVALVPALATLWPRIRMPEAKKFLESRELSTLKRPSSVTSTFTAGSSSKHRRQQSSVPIVSDGRELQEQIDAARAEIDAQSRRARLGVFFRYFSEWRHFRTLFGTSSTWFLMDVAFYGTNLNQSVILKEIGYSKGRNEYETLRHNAIGNLIIVVSGFLPGYFVTVFLIEKLGRRWIQIQGFLVTAMMFAVLAGDYEGLGTGGRFVCLAIAQFFFNFGPNSTTFVLPAELFPSRVRGFAHGVSAATGKLGAILSALAFNYLARDTNIGLPNVLWIYFACLLAGAIITYFTIPETRYKDADVIDYEEWFRDNVEGGWR